MPAAISQSLLSPDVTAGSNVNDNSSSRRGGGGTSDSRRAARQPPVPPPPRDSDPRHNLAQMRAQRTQSLAPHLWPAGGRQPVATASSGGGSGASYEMGQGRPLVPRGGRAAAEPHEPYSFLYTMLSGRRHT